MAKKKHDRQKKSARPVGRRPFWSGVISFGLVTVPVELFPSVRSRRVSMRMLDEDGTPLRRRYYNPETDELLEPGEITRGYEVDDGEFVLIDDDELEAISPKKSREIDLREFVDLSDIPSLFFDRAYYLTPSGESNKAYRLLASVMEDTGRAGIASFVMRGKEYLVAILAEEGILRAQILRFQAEVRSPSDVGLPEEKHRDEAKVKTFFRAIEENIADGLDPGELEDEHSKKVRELVDAKRKRNEDVVEPGEEVMEDSALEEDDEDEGGADLLETIRRHLQQENGRASGNGQKEQASDDLNELSKDELYQRAQDAEIPGRSKMKKSELIAALRKQ